MTPFQLYLTFVLIGIGYLLPLNAFIIAIDYLKLIFPQSNMEVLTTVSYTAGLLLVMVAAVVYAVVQHDDSKEGARQSIAVSVLPVTVGFGLTLVCTAAALFVGNSIVYCVLLFTIGVGTGAVQSQIFAVTAIFQQTLAKSDPNSTYDYTAGLLIGNAVAGTSINLIRIGCKLAFDSDQDGLYDSAVLFFSVTSVLLLLCIVGVELVIKPTMKEYASVADYQPISSPDVRVAVSNGNGTHKSAMRSSSKVDRHVPVTFKTVYAKIWQLSLCVLLTFTVTLSVYPATLATLKPHTVALQTEHWFAIVLITIFNASDLLGRALLMPATMQRWLLSTSGNTALALAVVRGLVSPIFIWHHTAKNGSSTSSLLTSDETTYFLCCLIGVTNGLLASIAMSSAPSKARSLTAEDDNTEHDNTESDDSLLQHDRIQSYGLTLIGRVMAMSLVAGLTIGSVVGSVMATYVVTDPN